MIDLKRLRDAGFVAELQEAARVKQIDFDAARLARAYDDRRALSQRFDEVRAEQKALSSRFRDADAAERATLSTQTGALSDELKQLKEQLAAAEAALHELALRAPNIPDPVVPVGTTDADNVEIRHWGEPRKMTDDMSTHVDLVGALGLAEFERVQKFAGSRSYALVGNGALLGRAVLTLAMDVIAQRGFVPVAPPVMVREEAMTGTGYFPLGVDDAYKTDREDRYLVGTSEVSLVSLHRDEIVDLADLPIRYAGVSSCFRREAGSHGRDTQGLYRVHQFDKVEQVVIAPADDELSLREHEALAANAESILQALELSYRVAIACTGDMGQGQRLKYEIETWMPSRDNYSETHSCSSFGDFQGRRSNIRYRTADGAVAYVYTLNNTAIALPRILIPLLEHHQTDDGSVHIPPALRPYLNGLQTLRPDTPPAALVPGFPGNHVS